MAKKEDAIRAWQAAKNKFKPDMGYRSALTGDGRGGGSQNFWFNRNEQYIWVREVGDLDKPFVVLNRGKIGPYLNAPVILGYTDTDRKREQVLDINWDAIPNTGGAGSTLYGMGAHGTTHMFGGGDEVYIDTRLFMPGLVSPTSPKSMQVNIAEFVYYYATWNKYDGGTSVDLSTYKPSGTGAVYLLIALSAETGNIVYRINSVTTGGGTWADLLASSGVGGYTSFNSDVPKPLGGEIPLAICYLTASTTEIDWSTNLNMIDARLHLQPSIADVLDRLDTLEQSLGYRRKTIPTLGARKAGFDLVANASAINSIPVSGNYNQGDQMLFSSATSTINWFSTSIVNSDFRIGQRNAAGTGAWQNLGNKLLFSGGPAPGANDSDNTDTMWIARFNEALDESEMRVNVSDNFDNKDQFVIGISEGGSAPAFAPMYTFGMGGDMILALNSSQVDTASMGSRVGIAYLSAWIDIPGSNLEFKIRRPDGGIAEGQVSLTYVS